MKHLITGGTGLIGQKLQDRLKKRGDEVFVLTRKKDTSSPHHLYWNPDDRVLDSNHFKDIDTVFHLAGESIAEGRWTPARKERIKQSRIQSTQLLVQAIAKSGHKPKNFFSASAVGFYGDTGDKIVDENQAPGKGFLAEVGQQWEESSQPLREQGIRLVHMRIGVVLSPEGGALQKMLLPFKMGLGGPLGSGDQYWSWITLDDILNAMEFLLDHEEIKGPVNFVSPQPLTNKEFTKALGQALHRPTVFQAPGFALKMAMGEMAQELLLASAGAKPKVLEEAGFAFEHPDIHTAFTKILD